MMAGTAPQAAGRSSLAPGKVVGGRFVVEGKHAEDALGDVLAARDQKTKKAIALRVLTPGLLDDAGIKVLRAECRTAAGLKHRNVVATYGVGTDAGGSPFVAAERVDGDPLSDLIEQRKQSGAQMSLRGAYNVIAHVCKALSFVHDKTCHGALRPSVVWVSRSGRVKVGGFGDSLAVLKAAGAAALGAREQACLAPEVKAGAEPTERSDIFGVGALLYTLLTGRSPADGFVPPSQAHPDATEAIDQVLLTCLAADPAARYGSPDEVRSALAPLVAEAPASTDDEDDFGVEIDIDLASEKPPAPAARPAPPVVRAPPPPAPPRANDAPAVGARVSIHEGFRAAGAAATAAATSEVDFQDLLAKITENDAPRWMVVKDNLDHGPFAGRELVELIVKSDIVGEHALFNMDTGERKPVGEWEDFREFLEQARLNREAAAHQQALVRVEKTEKRSNVFKLAVGGTIVAMIATVAGVYLATRGEATQEEIADADLAALYESGDIEIEGSAGILPDPPRRGGKGRGRGRQAGASGAPRTGGGLSYEEAMNQIVDLGSAQQGGGEARLSPATVAGVMNRHINSFFSCVSAELRRGGSLGTVQIDLAIAGDGSVLGASTRQGSGSFQACIAGRVRSVRFPSFSAPRMGARFSFSVQ